MTFNPLLVPASTGINSTGEDEGRLHGEQQQEQELVLAPGAAEYFKSVVDMLVLEWGVRFIKWDFGGSAAEARAYRDAIDATGVEGVVFNTHGKQQPGAPVQGGGPFADMYRVSYDMWDEFSFPWCNFEAALLNAAAARTGSNRGWMDLDMMPIGRVGGLENMSSPAHELPCSAASMACNKCTKHGGLPDACDDNRHPECCGRDSRLTFEEQRMMMTLWTISRSTLFVGGDPTGMSDAQASLFLNKEVLASENVEWNAPPPPSAQATVRAGVQGAHPSQKSALTLNFYADITCSFVELIVWPPLY